jgi:hypothetical protein
MPFPTAHLLSSLLCPEGDRHGNFKTRCRILLHLPAKLALATFERRGGGLRSIAQRDQ